MKNINNTQSKTLTAFLCCFFVSIYLGSAFYTSFPALEHNSQNKHNYAFETSSPHISVAQTNGQINFTGNLPVSTFKNFFSDISNCNKVSEQIIAINFISSDLFCIKEVLDFHATDIIFPFHVFL